MANPIKVEKVNVAVDDATPILTVPEDRMYEIMHFQVTAYTEATSSKDPLYFCIYDEKFDLMLDYELWDLPKKNLATTYMAHRGMLPKNSKVSSELIYCTLPFGTILLPGWSLNLVTHSNKQNDHMLEGTIIYRDSGRNEGSHVS